MSDIIELAENEKPMESVEGKVNNVTEKNPFVFNFDTNKLSKIQMQLANGVVNNPEFVRQVNEFVSQCLDMAFSKKIAEMQERENALLRLEEVNIHMERAALMEVAVANYVNLPSIYRAMLEEIALDQLTRTLSGQEK